MYCKVKSLRHLRQPHFSKGLTKLALQPGQKSGMILSFEVVLKLKLPKNHFNKKCAPKILFLNEKKIRKIRMIFDIENSL